MYRAPIYRKKCPVRRGIRGVEAAAGEEGESGEVVASRRGVIELEEGVSWWGDEEEEEEAVDSEDEGRGKLEPESYEVGYHDE